MLYTTSTKPMPNSIKQRRFLSAIFIAMAVLLLGLSIFQSLQKNMHHNMTWGAEEDSQSISIAISDMVFGLNRGYVSHAAVFNLFRERFWQGQALDDKAAIARMKDADFINTAIRDAIQLQIGPTAYAWGDFQPLLKREWIPVFAEDIGRSDYYKLAFSLFGFKIESMHFLYFLILSLSVGLFCVGFRDDLVGMTVLIVNLTVLNLIIASDIFSIVLPSISAYRGISALAIIPITHLTLAIWSGASWRSALAITGIAQTLLFLFVVWSRSSAQWGVLALMFISLMIWWRSKNRREFWRSVALLPLFLVLTGMAGARVYQQYAAHPAYFTDDLTPNHLYWHTAYIGLSFHPQYFVLHPGVYGDNIPFTASTRYLAETQPSLPATQSPITNGYWFRLHDRTIRYLFFQFALEHPRFMLELYGWWKPVRFVNSYIQVVRPFLGALPLLGLSSVMGILVLCSIWFPGPLRTVAASALVPSAVIAVTAITPIMWGYPDLHVMIDSIWATSVFVLMLIWSVLTLGLRAVCGAPG